MLKRTSSSPSLSSLSLLASSCSSLASMRAMAPPSSGTCAVGTGLAVSSQREGRESAAPNRVGCNRGCGGRAPCRAHLERISGAASAATLGVLLHRAEGEDARVATLALRFADLGGHAEGVCEQLELEDALGEGGAALEDGLLRRLLEGVREHRDEEVEEQDERDEHEEEVADEEELRMRAGQQEARL